MTRGGPVAMDVGREALGAGRWEEARDAFDSAGTDPEALEGLGEALWWLSDTDGAIRAWERAYVASRRAGGSARAAHTALLLSREYSDALGNDAAAAGWLARARDLLERDPDPVQVGWMALVDCERSIDPVRALSFAEVALSVARSAGDPDLELAALGHSGLAEIALGRIEDGMTHFDEAMAAATAGEGTDLRTLGDLYCSMVMAVEVTLDAARFEQWSEVVMGFMQRTRHPALLTFCGTCCAEVLRASGQWDEVEGWLTRTLRALQKTGQRARCVHPATRLAQLRVSQGRLEEAEQLLGGYEDLPEAVVPMVALSMARGQTALAAARLHRRLNDIGRDHLLAVPLLALLVEVQLAQPDQAGARETAEQLGAVAHAAGSDRARAEADLAAGMVGAAEGDGRAADSLERALASFVRLRMPHAAARAHLALARALDGDRSIEEARLALRAFEEIGATRDADSAAALLRSLGVAGRTGPKRLGELSKREVEVLRLLGEGLTNAEIAARLYISTKTVATHVGNIFAKLGIRNRTEAAALSRQHLQEDITA
ncbi:MAG TPA: LuxR C-terminal-related transcriptional regulator [Actinomycetota bacterium]